MGSALALESVPKESRGAVSGLLQQGYALGYLLAALLFWGAFSTGLVVGGACSWSAPTPAGLVLYIRAGFPVSSWGVPRAVESSASRLCSTTSARFLYLDPAHGHLQPVQPRHSGPVSHVSARAGRSLSAKQAGLVAAISSLGALFGGLTFGTLSERFGRRRAITCAALLSIPMIPLWVLAPSTAALAVGAFLLQFMVQGAWGAVPAHLSELSPGFRARHLSRTWRISSEISWRLQASRRSRPRWRQQPRGELWVSAGSDDRSGRRGSGDRRLLRPRGPRNGFRSRAVERDSRTVRLNGVDRSSGRPSSTQGRRAGPSRKTRYRRATSSGRRDGRDHARCARVGLAAPQIGVGWQLIVVEDDDDRASSLSDAERQERARAPLPLTAIVNPRLQLLGEAARHLLRGLPVRLRLECARPARARGRGRPEIHRQLAVANDASTLRLAGANSPARGRPPARHCSTSTECCSRSFAKHRSRRQDSGAGKQVKSRRSLQGLASTLEKTSVPLTNSLTLWTRFLDHGRAEIIA